MLLKTEKSLINFYLKYRTNGKETNKIAPVEIFSVDREITHQTVSLGTETMEATTSLEIEMDSVGAYLEIVPKTTQDY